MTPEQIIGEVAIATGIPAPAITGKRRTLPVVRARILVIAHLRESSPWLSITELAAAVNRTHRAAANGLQEHPILLQTSPDYRRLYHTTRLALLHS